MSRKKTKQRAQKDVTNGTRKIRNQRDMLRVLLHRDPRSATLAHLILQLYGYCPREQERSDEEIAAEMQTLREALAQAYGVDMDERPLPQAEELEEIRQGIISDLESGNEWLHPDGVELLAFLDQACPTLTAHIRHEMSTQQIPETLKANVLNTLVDNVMNTFEGIASREGQDETIDHLRLVIQAIHAEARAQQFTEWSDAEKEGRITQALEQEVKH